MNTGLRSIALLLLCATAARGEAPEPGFSDAPIQDASPQVIAEDMSPAMFGMAVIAGADGRLAIVQVAPGSPAAEAGLQSGDIIVSADGQFLTQPDRLQEFLAAHPATPIQFAVERDGKPLTIEINAPADVPATLNANRPDLDVDARPALGVRFVAGNQVILAETLAGSPAEAAGLQAGDQLIAVNGDVIASSDHFITRIAAAEIDEPLTITFLRGADRRTTTITPAAWDGVFTATHVHTTLKPDVTTVVPTTVWPGRVTNMSPVGVPLIAYPYYFPSAYTYWGFPHYSYYAGYSNFYPYFGYYPYYYGYYPYYAYSYYGYYPWPYAVRWGGPYPGRPGHSATQELDSAQQSAPSDAGLTANLR